MRADAMTVGQLISIIMPYHDAASYLADAIGSVRAQTHQHWELILVDDRSTDEGPALAAAAAAGDPRIRLLSTPASGPHGAAAARNLGLSQATGDFVAFLDSDDVFAPDKLERELAILRLNPSAGMVYGATRWWFPDAPKRDWTEDMRSVAGRVHAPPALLRDVVLLQKGYVPCTCAVMIRKDVIDVVGGFDERFQLYEDQTLWVKIFAAYPVYVTDLCLSRYRQHAASTSAKAERDGDYHRTRPHKARTAFLAWVGDYLVERQIEDRRLLHALRLARARYDAPAGLQRQIDRSVLALRDLSGLLRVRLAPKRLARALLRHLRRITAPK